MHFSLFISFTPSLLGDNFHVLRQLILLNFFFFHFAEKHPKSICWYFRSHHYGSHFDSARFIAGCKYSNRPWNNSWEPLNIYCIDFWIFILGTEFIGLRLYSSQNGHVSLGSTTLWRGSNYGKSIQFHWLRSRYWFTTHLWNCHKTACKFSEIELIFETTTNLWNGM